jgi:hypothetical protein
VIVIPGMALFVLVLGINLLGDGLRDAFGTRSAHMSTLKAGTSSALLEVEDLGVSFGRTRRRARRVAHGRARRDPSAWWANRAAASR